MLVPVTTHIGGFSVLQQYLSGSFERVELTAPKLVVTGAPLSAKVVATGVPADFSKPIADATGTLSISQESLNKLVKIPGASHFPYVERPDLVWPLIEKFLRGAPAP
jgi:pimeloyl-ACP methyl ester carboxylesterase